MSDWTFHPTLVRPFYGPFMNGNIVSYAPEERRAVLDLFKARLPQYTENDLRSMIRSSWRPAKVAAWVIAVRRLHGLRSEVLRQLVQAPDHAEHLCICLSRLGGDEALAALQDYMDGCASGRLKTNPYDETISAHWAVAAIENLDPRRGDDAVRLWETFVERELPVMRPHWTPRLQQAREVLGKVMLLLDELA